MADENDLNIKVGIDAAATEPGSRKAKANIKGVTDESKQLEQSFRRIKAAIDPTFAATERYNRTLAEAKSLLKANMITKKEYAAAVSAAKTALDQEAAAIQRNSAAGRAAAAEAKRLKQEEAAAAKAAATEAAQAARETAQAQRQAQREAAAEVRKLQQEEKAAVRAAAQAAKEAAREKAAAERQAQREIAAAARQAANESKQAAREKATAERLAAREMAEAEKQARREQRAAAKQAATDAATAAKAKKAAERDAANETRKAAQAARDLAKAEKQAAAAAQDLRSSVDPAFAAMTRYNDVMRRATALLMQNKLKTGEWTAIQRAAKAQMDVNVRSMGRFNAAYVQLGYNSQDVIASLASGINPMVILAQQGGQTAAALATLGGTIGKVASFMAGPWGAAILGVTVLLGYLWSSEEEGKKKTLDLMDAESRRAATVRDLTAALRDYVAQQREANNQNLENLTIENNKIAQAANEAIQKRTDAQEALNRAQENYNKLLKEGPGPGKAGQEIFAGKMAVASSQLEQATKDLAAAQGLAANAERAHTESRVKLGLATANATAAEIEHQAKLQEIVTAYRVSNKSLADYQKMLADTRAENARYNIVKEQEAEARRANEKAAKDEAKAIFQSRQAAIQLAGTELRKQGYNVGENVAFGGVKANHPGMGNQAHGQFAIDVNIPGAGAEAYNEVTKKRMDAMVAAYQARGFRVLWNGKVYSPHGQGASYDIPAGKAQHKDHAHIEAPQSIVGQSAGKGLADKLVQDAKQVADEQRRIEEEALQDSIANMEFRKELANEDLQTVLSIQNEKIAAIRQFYGEESREAQNAQREKVRIERQIAQQTLQIARENINQKLSLAQQGLERELSIRSTIREMQGTATDFQSGAGLMGDQQALAQKRAILEQEFSDQVRHETRIYQLKAQAVRDQLALSNLTLDARRQLNDQLEQLEADHLNRMTALQNNQSKAIQQLNIQSANISAQTWRGVAQSITQSMGSAFQGMWTHSITWQQALINMGDAIVYKFADMGLKMVEDWMVQQAVKLGLIKANQAQEVATHATTQAAITGVTATGEATRTAIGTAGVVAKGGQEAAKAGATVASEAVQTGAKTAGEATRGTVGAAGAVAEIGTRAATSAAGAFSSTVVIPFIGPVAAPIAAAAALAAVLGFAALVSARGGQGEVGSDGQLSMLHKKEMVLPAWIAEPMRQQLKTRGSSAPMFGGAAAAGSTARTEIANNNGGPQFYYQPKNTLQNMSMSEMLRQDGRELRRWLRNEFRNGSFGNR